MSFLNKDGLKNVLLKLKDVFATKLELPKKLSDLEIDIEVGSNAPLSKGQGENSVKQTPPSPTFEKKNEILEDEKGTFIEADALGDYAVALGGTAAAVGKRSVAQGHRCVAEGETSHAEGNCAVVKYLDETLNGYGSHAEGYSTVVAGVYSHAEGSKTVVVGNNSHAEGGETSVSADMAHSEGYKTTVGTDADGAHAEGNSTSAFGKYSHTEGRQTTTVGEASHAEGVETHAKMIGSHAEGYKTRAEAESSHAEGGETYARGNYSHAEGYKTTSTGLNSHAEGFESHSLGDYSHAEGRGCTSTGEASHSEGIQCNAKGLRSHAEGRESVSEGNSSHAEGWVCNAKGEYSHAEGQNTKTYGIASHSEGLNSEAHGPCSHAEGLGTKTNENIMCQHVEGFYNNVTDSLKIIGCGTSDEDRKNAVEVTQDGRVFVKGIGNYDGTSLEAVDLKTALDHKANSGDVYNKSEINNIINVELVKKKDVATINGKSILEGGNIVITGEEGGSSITPDWNAQEDEAGYIENRTHYINEEVAVEKQYIGTGSNIEGNNIFRIKSFIRFNSLHFKFFIEDTIDNITTVFEYFLSPSDYTKPPSYIGEYEYDYGKITFNEDDYSITITLDAPYFIKQYLEIDYINDIKKINDLFIPDTIARKSELTELSEEVSGLSERIDNLPSAESDVFKAIYGTTTYEEIKAAYDSGKVVHCDYESYCYTLVRIADTAAYFTCMYSSTAKNLVCYSNSTWKVAGNVLEATSNKTTTISESSTDTQYPSAKAVYDALQNVGGSSVFEAVYNTTTYEEIVAAHNAGKWVVCAYENRNYHLSSINSSNAFFATAEANTNHRVWVTSDNKWYKASYVMLTTGDKVTTINESSVDTKVPSAKAVYDFVGKQGVIRQTQTWTQAADKGYDYVMSNLVRGAIPQANIDLFTSAGAIFNEESGYFELNGLTDISYEEMVKIYAVTNPLVGRMTLTASLINADVRTNLPIFTSTADAFGNGISSNMDLGGMAQSSKIEYLCIYGDNVKDDSDISNWLRITSIIFSARFARHLRKVKGYLSLNLSSTSSAFNEAFSLEEIYLKSIKSNISFKDSSRLSYDSVKYMIGKSTPSSAITFTLHATALANAEASYLADGEQDHTAYPTLSDWALSKNIQIATA